MNGSYARLQRTLRAIERGERLESVDPLLVREVLQQAPPPRAPDPVSETVVHGSDAYRVLLELRKQRPKPHAKPPAPLPDAKKAPSPEKQKKPSLSPSKTLYVDKTEEDRRQFARNQADKDEDELRKAEVYRHEMANALAATQRQLNASENDVLEAAAEMDALLKASQSVLSSTFLFERNLTEFCQERSLEVIQRVLQRFHHRFYKLYYQKWVEYTRILRRMAQERAVATIVRVVRGHNARKLKRWLQKEAAKLQAQARQVIELRVTYRTHQAIKIQRVWRRYQWTQHERARQRRRQAAKYLQQQWRDRKLRRNALISALLNIKEIRAAIRIQRIARGFVTRRRITRQRRENQRQAMAMQVLTRNTNREAMIHWQLERHGAAFVITTALYPMMVRERFRRLARDLKRQKAARVIAANVVSWHRHGSTYRQKQQALVAERLHLLLQREQTRLDTAAVVLQKTIRRWWYQQQYKTQQTRRKKLARRTRIQEKQARMARKDTGGNRAAVALAKASAGLTDVMKQARKKPPASTVDGPSKAASLIQRTYLRHRHAVHFQWTQWRQRACGVEARVLKRRQAAIMIQKHVRGLLARRRARLIRAQHLMRQHIVRWKWRRATRRSQAARQIIRWLKHKRTQRLAKLWKLEKQRQHVMATRLQHWLRCGFFYRKRVARLLSNYRKHDEARAFAAQSLVVSTQHFMDAVILASAQDSAFDEGIKSYVKGLLIPVKPLAKPPVRALFPILPLLFLVVSGFKDPTKWPTIDVKDLVVAKIDRSKMIALFRAANKFASAPARRQKKPTEVFAMTDVDLAMATAAGASKRALVFSEFIETLQRLADLKLSHVTLWWSQYDGAEARVLALLWQFVFPIAELQPFVVELKAHVARVIDAHARVVQRLFLKQRAVAHGLLIKLQMQQQRDMEFKRRAIIKVQAHVRRLLARKTHRIKIQQQYEKYIDPDWSLPYWMNPKTGYSTWQKPWVLGDVDVQSETVPFPPTDQILTVPCQGASDCATCSDWFCYTCDEFFCSACEPVYHKKKDRDHDMERLRKCGLCQFQVASRSCTSCAAAVKKKPKTLSELETETEATEVLYCDVCFAFVHRRGMLQVHASTPLVALCDDCQDDDALLDAEKAPLKPLPYPRAVQWTCETDHKRVCGRCAWQRHPVEACGKLTKLTLVTIRMRERTERLKREQEERERSDTELIRQRELLVKQERAAKKLQRFWHNSAPLMRARRIARSLRAGKDAAWQQHQTDRKVQKTLKFRVKDAFGMAPPLPSDSLAMRRLRDMNLYQRRQLSHRARAFGLLEAEYMQLGVPLPGIVRVTSGVKFLECSEDLRGWIRNRQTLRLKKLPSKAERERARRIRYRHDEPPLEDKAWLHDLERWMRNPNDTVLVDVDATQRITEHNIPLAAAFAGTSSDASDEYAVFLVEFSMDPARIVWVSHSLAERFAVWRKQMLREYREKRKLQVDAETKASEPAQSPAIENASGDEAPIEDPPPSAGDPAATAAVTTDWGAYTGEGYDYSTYYGQSTWVAASSSWYNYGAESTAYYNYAAPSYGSTPQYDCTNTYATTPSYDYANPAPNAVASTYQDTYTASTGGGGYTDSSQLVSSTNYFYADDGNAAAWEAYYAAHPELASGYDATVSASQAQDTYAAYDTSYTPQDAWGYATNSADPYATAAATDAYRAPTNALYPWEEVFDPTTQQTYYYNRETQATSWEYPY